MKNRTNWGILGCGEITKKFASALLSVPEAKLLAVASATTNQAKQYANQFGADYFYDNYLDLLQHSDIDIVYVANCNSQHFATVRQCLENNKAVLCEKPLALNAQQVQALIELANKRGLFLMEGMWMCFQPAIQKAKTLIQAGMIGDVKIIQADFGYASAQDGFSRQFNLSLGGGALLDVGIYPLYLAYFFLNKMPVKVSSSACLAHTGVDEYSAYLLEYDSGEIASLSASISLRTSQQAEVIGTKGRISIPKFWDAQGFTVQFNSGEQEIFSYPHGCNGFEYEIQAVIQCLAEGKKQSKVIPWQVSINIVTLMDQLRRQWGLCYSVESNLAA